MWSFHKKDLKQEALKEFNKQKEEELLQHVFSQLEESVKNGRSQSVIIGTRPETFAAYAQIRLAQVQLRQSQTLTCWTIAMVVAIALQAICAAISVFQSMHCLRG